MPVLDRHWWLRVLFACGASTVAVAYVVWCVRTALSIPLDSPVHPGPAVVVFAILIPQLLFLTARYTICIALPSRQRARLLAIRGNHEAVPASLIAPHPERAPDVTAEPLVIAWLPFTFRRSETAPAWSVLILCVLLMLLVTFFMSLGAAMTSYHTFPEIVLHTALSALLFSALAIAFLLGATIIGVVFSGVWSVGIASPIIAFFGKPFDVAANAEGVTTHDLWGRTHHVRWDDARLLEVSIAPPVLGHYRIFTLYGRDSYVRWRDDTGSHVRAPTLLDGITREEGSKRLQSLLDLIAVRTGLAPRTFDGTLAADRRDNLPRLLRQSLRMLPPTLACATLAIVSSQFPLTNAAMLNRVSSTAYCILAAGCLIFTLTYRRRSPAAARQDALPDMDSAIAAQDAQQAYAVYASNSRSQTLAVFFASLLVCIAALPLLFAWFGTLDTPALYVFRAVQFSSLWPSQAAAVLIGLFGAVGLFVLVLAAKLFFAKSVTLDVQADAEGLRDRGGIKDAFLPWDAIDVITRSADVDGEVRYTVTGDYARNTITWSTTYALPADPGLPLPAVTPDQLAAIVVARSGKPLTLR